MIELVVLGVAVGAAVLALVALAATRRAVGTALSDAGGRIEDHSASTFHELGEMTAELRRVNALVAAMQGERAEQQGRLEAGLRQTFEASRALNDTTQSLRQALAGSRSRGQWGERMADDVLRLAGFVEGVNYRKQQALAGGTIPDFTFLLPRDRVLHMDVKFPLDNYLRHLEAESPRDAEAYRSAFLKDMRARVRELSGRAYIDADTTVDAVLLFIPNESIYGFIHQHDPALVDAALGQKVVLCSPFTLFAVLAVVRQSVDLFMVERAGDEILQSLAAFTGQWDKFSDAIDLVGRRFDSTQKAFDELAGPRRRQLQRAVDQVDALRAQRGLEQPGRDERLDPAHLLEPPLRVSSS